MVNLFEALMHLVNPPLCPMCGRALCMDEAGICFECIRQLPRTEEAINRNNKLELLFTGDDKFVRGGAFCFYPEEHPFREAIHAMKYYDMPEIGETLGKTAATEWLPTGFFKDIDLIIPLPLHKRRFRQRGYNQAEWIARGLNSVTDIPIDTKHLIRTVNNDKQANLSLERRRELGNIFSVNHPEELQGKHILLVDDVVTTGSTILRAMKNLHPIRRCRYSVFALALAAKH